MELALAEAVLRLFRERNLPQEPEADTAGA